MPSLTKFQIPFALAQLLGLTPRPTASLRRVDPRPGLTRNKKCWCGSGKKTKRCHSFSLARAVAA